MPPLPGSSAPARTDLRIPRPAGNMATSRPVGSRGLSLALLAACLNFGCSDRVDPPPGPMEHEAYLWQDPGRPEAAAALARARDGKISAIAVLAAEATMRDGNLVFREIAPLPSGPDITHVMRLGQSTTAHIWTTASRETISRQIERLAAASPREIQIDFDCPARLLTDYCDLLDKLRARAGGVPVAFTALPSWLDAPAFPALARAHPRFVLQVHALDLPARPGDPLVLCDPEVARRAVEKASGFGTPFRVALPTYGSEVLFGGDGKILDVVSEDAARAPAVAVTGRQRVFADPVAMAGLVRDWTTRRPRGLSGICWYRLPVDGDRRNWSWTTFSEAMAGRASPVVVEIESRAAGPGLRHITLVNPGAAHAALPESFSLPTGTLAADATRPYHVGGGTTPVFLLDPADPAWPWLAPGQSLVVGWFRHPDPDVRIPPRSPP